MGKLLIFNPKNLMEEKQEALLKKIGMHIREARKTKGLTQAELATKIEVDQAYITRVEKGQKNLTVLTLLKIAEALNLQPVIELVEKYEKGEAL